MLVNCFPNFWMPLAFVHPTKIDISVYNRLKFVLRVVEMIWENFNDNDRVHEEVFLFTKCKN